MVPDNNLTELDLINALASEFADVERSEVLRGLVQLFVRKYLLDGPAAKTPEELQDAITEEIESRLRACRSNAFAHDLLTMAANNDPDFYGFVFPDGRASVVLVTDSEIAVNAEGLLQRYLDYIANYPEYDLIHPSDYSVPKDADEDLERQRLLRDWSQLIRQLRDGLIRSLLNDRNRRELR